MDADGRHVADRDLPQLQGSISKRALIERVVELPANRENARCAFELGVIVEVILPLLAK